MLFRRGRQQHSAEVLYLRHALPDLYRLHHCIPLLLVCAMKEELKGGPCILVHGSPAPLLYVFIEERIMFKKDDPLLHNHCV